MPKDWENLLKQVEALCEVYVGKNAGSEPWGITCNRLAALDKLAKKIRRLERRGGVAAGRG